MYRCKHTETKCEPQWREIHGSENPLDEKQEEM